MDKIAFSFGILKVYWYSIFILFGIALAFFIIYREIIKQKMDKEMIIDMAISAIIVGIIGARIYYVLFNMDYYINNILEIFQIYKGGLAIHGGLLAGFLYIVYFCRKNKLSVLKILDIVVVGLIIGQAVGRWGNFFNQEAYGRIISYNTLISYHIPMFIIKGMKIGEYYYTPTFLYESIWNLIGFSLLLLIRKMPELKVGMLSGIYLIWYSFGRFFIESLRTDSLMLFNIKIAQLVSILLIFIGIVLIIFSRKNIYYHEIKNKRKSINK